VDYAVVEGFKHSDLPKIVMDDIEVTNVVRRVRLADVDEALVEDLAEMVRGMEEYNADK
jgi:molybdopterin-guanine dinucleotide biosynthesis protein